jgi:hypothetical protein
MRYPVGATAGASHSSLTVRAGRHATSATGNTSAAMNRAAEFEMIIFTWSLAPPQPASAEIYLSRAFSHRSRVIQRVRATVGHQDRTLVRLDLVD